LSAGRPLLGNGGFADAERGKVAVPVESRYQGVSGSLRGVPRLSFQPLPAPSATRGTPPIR